MANSNGGGSPETSFCGGSHRTFRKTHWQHERYSPRGPQLHGGISHKRACHRPFAQLRDLPLLRRFDRWTPRQVESVLCFLKLHQLGPGLHLVSIVPMAIVDNQTDESSR
jgi:hypothetical protein